ncbi:MAG: quinolinate synthase NadA [Thermoplasmatales archaeon]|nr:quinolinate synthase NadA [Thermoplasmatales archaeon]
MMNLDRLKKEKNAVILAHNYQLPEIQDVADYLGDSLALAQSASKTDTDVIVVCGVDFMAETALILSPDKVVVLPDLAATCPMAAMATPEKLKRMKNEHPNARVVSYVNTTAEIKALSDVCCTSANAVNVVKSLPEKEIIFVPDMNLGKYVQRFTSQKIILWPGYCYVHRDIKKEQIIKLKKMHQDAEILVHPECSPEVIDTADFVYSTGGMVEHAKKSNSKEFIIGTEEGLCYRLKKENPDKKFYSTNSVCSEMKKITFEKLVHSLETLKPRINLPDKIIEDAREPIEKMMKIGKR